MGDCRAILGTRNSEGGINTHPLSVDHGVDLPLEKARLEAGKEAAKRGTREAEKLASKENGTLKVL